jgi:hypothetical protein
MNELKKAATHEAGHAVVAEAMGFRVHSATIEPSGEFLGGVFIENAMPEHRQPLTARETEQLERVMVFLYAGYLAECRVCPREPGPRDHEDQMFMYDCAMVATAGKPTRDQYERAAERAVTAVQACWPMVEAAAAALVAEKTLTGDRLREVLKPYDLAGARAGLTAILF